MAQGGPVAGDAAAAASTCRSKALAEAAAAAAATVAPTMATAVFQSPPGLTRDLCPQAWIGSLRAEARQMAGDRLDEKAKELFELAEEKLRQFDGRQQEVTDRLEEEMRRCREHTQRLQEDREQMHRTIVYLQERLEIAEAAAAAAGAFAPPGLGPWASPGAASPLLHPAVPASERATVAAATAGQTPVTPPLEPLQGLPGLRGSGGDKTPSPPSSPDPSLIRTCYKEDEDDWGDIPGSPQLPPPAVLKSPKTSGRATTPRPLGAGTPPRTPKLALTPQRSARSSAILGASTPMKSPLVAASPFVICEGGGCVFGFTLRIAHGVELGLEVTHGGDQKGLKVIGVKPDGAIAAWNRQCVSGPGAGKEVKFGDRIVAVNGTSEAAHMLNECREKRMLKLTVVRGDADCALPAGWAGGAHLPATLADRSPVGTRVGHVCHYMY